MFNFAGPVLALSLISAVDALSAQPAMRTYAVEVGVAGVVDLYDLSSETRTPHGFSLQAVATFKQFPRAFGPVAYRVSHETYHCGRETYDITAVQDYGRDGRLIRSLAEPLHGGMHVVAATASSEMYNRFCPEGVGGRLAGLTPVRIVQAKDALAASRIGRDMLATTPEGFGRRPTAATSK